MADKTIYDLKLHESVEVDGYRITRVPGGWLYCHFFSKRVIFIPFNNEFQQ